MNMLTPLISDAARARPAVVSLLLLLFCWEITVWLVGRPTGWWYWVRKHEKYIENLDVVYINSWISSARVSIIFTYSYAYSRPHVFTCLFLYLNYLLCIRSPRYQCLYDDNSRLFKYIYWRTEEVDSAKGFTTK